MFSVPVCSIFCVIGCRILCQSISVLAIIVFSLVLASSQLMLLTSSSMWYALVSGFPHSSSSHFFLVLSLVFGFLRAFSSLAFFCLGVLALPPFRDSSMWSGFLIKSFFIWLLSKRRSCIR